MNEYRFKIEKERVYRGYAPEKVMTFSQWLANVYLTRESRYMFRVMEDETYIKLKLSTYKQWEYDTVRQFVLTVLSDFKSYFIQTIIGDFKVAYLDLESKHHSSAIDFIDKLRYNAFGDEVMSLFDILSKMELEFMTLEKMVNPPVRFELAETVIVEDNQFEDDKVLETLKIELKLIDDEFDK